MHVSEAHDPHAVDTREAQRLHTLRKQMREQDLKRYRDPDENDPRRGIYVVYIWREVRVSRRQWFLAAFKWMTPTPARLRRWRKKLKVRDNEMMRVVDLITAQRFGAGAAPQLPPLSKRPARLRKQNRVLFKKEEAKTTYKKPRTHPSMTHCDYEGRGKRCSVRAPWYVGYTSSRTRRRIIKRRCTRHAWHGQYLPEGARHVVIVRREVRR